MKLVTVFLLLLVVFNNMEAHAALKYQQELTFSSWKSKEDVGEMVQAFCKAAIGDPDIKVISVEYSQNKKRGVVTYNATLMCHVSKVDDDLTRINGIVFQQKHGLK